MKNKKSKYAKKEKLLKSRENAISQLFAQRPNEALVYVAQKGDSKLLAKYLDSFSPKKTLEEVLFSKSNDGKTFLELSYNNPSLLKSLNRLELGKGDKLSQLFAQRPNEALVYVAQKGDSKLLEKYLDSFSPEKTLEEVLFSKSNDGKTFLELSYNNPSLLKYLNRLILENGDTLLHVAAKNGNASLYKALIKSGANQKTKDKNGFPPIYYIAGLKEEYFKPFLAIDNIDLTTKSRAEENTVLHRAVGIQDFESAQDICTNPESRLLINTQNKAGNTPLHNLMQINFVGSEGLKIFKSTLKVFIDNGADFNIVNNEGNTSLKEAISHASKDMLVELFSAINASELDNTSKSELYELAKNDRHTSDLKELCVALKFEPVEHLRPEKQTLNNNRAEIKPSNSQKDEVKVSNASSTPDNSLAINNDSHIESLDKIKQAKKDKFKSFRGCPR